MVVVYIIICCLPLAREKIGKMPAYGPSIFIAFWLFQFVLFEKFDRSRHDCFTDVATANPVSLTWFKESVNGIARGTSAHNRRAQC